MNKAFKVCSLVSIGVAFALLVSRAFAADTFSQLLSAADGGNICSTRLGSKQYALQCDGGMFARTCKDGGDGCLADPAKDVHLDPLSLYDIPLPGNNDTVCVTPDIAAPSSCKLFVVDPGQSR